MPAPSPLAALAAALAPATLAGCFTYQPGSFQSSRTGFPSHRVTIGCLDVGVATVHDRVVTGPVVEYRFGNRCDHAVPVDLAAVRVTGRTRLGDDVAMVPYDPYRDLRRLPLDGRSSGGEQIAYRTARDFGSDVVQLCVDLTGITDGGSPTVACLAADAQVASAGGQP